MPALFMDAKSSSSGFTSGEELDSSNSSLGDETARPVPRRWGTGPGQRKNKNRDAARKSRKKQTEKADELHKEHQCLERSNVTLVKEIAALRAEVQRYTAVLERHQPSCPLLAAGRSEASVLSLASASTSTPTFISIPATTLQEGSSRPSETPCSPADSNPSSASDVACPDRPRVSDVAPMVLTSCSRRGPASSQPPHPAHPAFGAPGHCRATSGPGDPATPSVTHAFALSTPVLTTSSFSDPPQLGDSSSSSSSTTSTIHLFNSHPLPPLASSRGKPASFAPLHPAPDSNLHSRSDRGSLETSATSGPVAVLHPHSQGGPAGFFPYLGNPIHGSPVSSSVHAYQTGSPGSVFTTTSSGPVPYRSLMPGNLLPPLGILDHFDVLLPAVSMGTPSSTTFSELMPTLWDFSSDTALSQLLQTEDWFQDC
ncbi:unnamed protein product [Lota lota]